MYWNMVFDIWRLGNFALALAAGWLVIKNARRYYLFYSAKMRDYVWAMSLFVFLSLVSTVENIIQDNEPGTRVPIMTLALIYMIRGLRRSHSSKSLQGK